MLGLQNYFITAVLLRKRIVLVTDAMFIWEGKYKDKPCNPTHFADLYKKALLGIEGMRYLSPHCCRHTYVSQIMDLIPKQLQFRQQLQAFCDEQLGNTSLEIGGPGLVAALIVGIHHGEVAFKAIG